MPIMIGNNCFINQRCIIRPHIIIVDNVSIAPMLMLLSDTNGIGNEFKRTGKAVFKPIKIGNGCWICAETTILGGLKIGDGTILAAGTLVYKDCEPNSLYAGAPAMEIKHLQLQTKNCN